MSTPDPLQLEPSPLLTPQTTNSNPTIVSTVPTFLSNIPTPNVPQSPNPIDSQTLQASSLNKSQTSEEPSPNVISSITSENSNETLTIDQRSSPSSPMDTSTTNASSNSNFDRTGLLTSMREKFTSIFKELLSAIEHHPDETEILMEFGDLLKEELREARPEVFIRWSYTSAQIDSSRVSSANGSRPVRIPGLSNKKKTFLKKRRRNESCEDLLTSTESILCSIPLSKLLSVSNFNKYVPASVKDSLMKLLPQCDCESPETVTEMFQSPEFIQSLDLFQRHLQNGTFDGSQDVLQYRKSKKLREVDPWKLQHFEQFWGQLTICETLLKEPSHSIPNFSYADVILPDIPDPLPIIDPGPSVPKYDEQTMNEMRKSLVCRDTKDLFNFIFPEGKLEHFKRRRAAMHRNPSPELFVRCTNIINRRINPPDYENITWRPPDLNAWLQEFEKINTIRIEVETEAAERAKLTAPVISTMNIVVPPSSSTPVQILNSPVVITNPSPVSESGPIKITQPEPEVKIINPPKEINLPIQSPNVSIPLRENSSTSVKPAQNFPAIQPIQAIQNLQSIQKPVESQSSMLTNQIQNQHQHHVGNAFPTKFQQQSTGSLQNPLLPSVASVTGVTGLSSGAQGYPATINPANLNLNLNLNMNFSPMTPQPSANSNSGTTSLPSLSNPTLNNNSQVPSSNPTSLPLLSPSPNPSSISGSFLSSIRQSPMSSYPGPGYGYPIHNPPSPHNLSSPIPGNPSATSIGSSLQFHPHFSSSPIINKPQEDPTPKLQPLGITPTAIGISNPVPQQIVSGSGLPSRAAASIAELAASFQMPSTILSAQSDDEDQNDEDYSEDRPKRPKKPAPLKRSSKPSFRTVAYDILKRERRPLQPKEIVAIALKEELLHITGKTPENTLASVLYKDIQQNKDPPSIFIKFDMKPVAFGLREWTMGNQ